MSMNKNNLILQSDNNTADSLYFVIISVFFLLVNLFSNKAFSQVPSPLASLESDGKVQVKIYQERSVNKVPNQQITLIIEVLSAHPFASDFTLPYLDFDNSVVIQPNGNAELATKLIAEQLWFIQRKKIITYPLTSGQFDIAPIKVGIYLNTQHQETLSGSIQTQPYSFEVAIPSPLTDANNIIASSHVEFSLSSDLAQRKQAKDKHVLKGETVNEHVESTVGSAITYHYTTKADNMHVIMLSKLKFDEIDGLQIYRKPSIEKDEFDRFEKFNTAILTQTVTYIFEQEGIFTIPEQRLVWWDTVNNELREEVIAKQVIIVGKATLNAEATTSETKSSSAADSVLSGLTTQQLIRLLFITAVLIFIVALIRQVMRHKQSLLAEFHHINKTKNKQLYKRYNEQIENQDYQSAISSLYKIAQLNFSSVDSLSKHCNQENLNRLTTLKQLAFSTYATAGNQESKAVNQFSSADGKQLLDALTHQQANKTKRQPFKFSYKLNPDKR